MKHYKAEALGHKSQSLVVYINTPAIPSCFVAFFSDPYSPFEIFNFLELLTKIALQLLLNLFIPSLLYDR